MTFKPSKSSAYNLKTVDNQFDQPVQQNNQFLNLSRITKANFFDQSPQNNPLFELKLLKSEDIAVQPSGKKVDVRRQSEWQAKAKQASLFVKRIRQDKQQFQGKLFMIKKKSEQVQKQKSELESRLRMDKKLEQRAARLQRAYTNIQEFKQRSLQREKQKLRKYEELKIQLPHLREKNSKQSIDIFSISPKRSTKSHANTTAESTFQDKIKQNYFKSKFYLQQQTKKQIAGKLISEKSSLLQKKKDYSQRIRNFLQPQPRTKLDLRIGESNGELDIEDLQKLQELRRKLELLKKIY